MPDGKPQTKVLKIEVIQRTHETQGRADMPEWVVEQYADVYADLPAPKVCQDKAGAYWLWDGFATVAATEAVGRKTIKCLVWEGEKVKAQWYAAGANFEHDSSGRRRTNADKRRAVELALSCPNSDERSDAEIARHCGVAVNIVAELRQTIPPNGPLVSSDDLSPPDDGVPSVGVAALRRGLTAAKKRAKKKTKKAAKKAPKPGKVLGDPDAEEIGTDHDPAYLKGTKAELKSRWVKNTDDQFRKVCREGMNLSKRLGCYAGRVEDIYKQIWALRRELEAIAKGA